MICTNCGSEVPDTARVCGHCGHVLKAAAPDSLARSSTPGWVWGAVGALAAVALLVLIVAGVLFATGVIALPGNREATSPPMSPQPASETQATTVPEAQDSRILFIQNIPSSNAVDIYVMDNDGRNLTQLTADGVSSCPAWSPDRKRVVFCSGRDGDFEIYVMDADGKNVVQLTNRPENDRQPAWSPDGKRIVFRSMNMDGGSEILVMDADGGNLTSLTKSDEWQDDPTWSPDGGRIAFTRCGARCEIFVMDADGGNVHALNAYTVASGLDWSPDGNRIAFPCDLDQSGKMEICVMDIDGSNIVQLTNSPENYVNYDPAWSPDGKRITFTSGPRSSNQSDIYVMDADGRNVLRLTHQGDNLLIRYQSDW